MSDEQKNRVDSAIEAGKKLALLASGVKSVEDGGIPFVLVPNADGGYEVETVENLFANPAARRATVELRDAASFITYVNKFSDDHTLIFANIADRTITAVLDYHEPGDGKPRWGKHRAQLTCTLSADWKRWAEANGKRKNQVEFATFLEDNLHNIAEPHGATVLEVAKTLIAKKSVNFKSSVRLDNGEHQFTYEETVEGQSKGSLEIPQKFTLGIEPFEGTDKYALEARLRYRIDGGRLEMWFDLIRHEAVVEDAFKETREKIEGAVKVPVLAGKAPTIA